MQVRRKGEISRSWARVVQILFLIALALAWLNAGKTNVYAQTVEAAPQPTPVQDCAKYSSLATDSDLQNEERMLDELKCWRAVGPALQLQVKAQQKQIDHLDKLSMSWQQASEFWKEAAGHRGNANTLEGERKILEAERDRIRREQLEEYRAEVARLREENDKLRASRDRRTLLGIGVGYGACQLKRL